MSLQLLLKETTASLDDRNIPYMISGSLAMTVYTVARMTRDIDIVIELDPDNLNAFLKIFSSDFYVSEENIIKEEIKRRGMFNVIDNRSGFKIDFVVRKNTAFRRKEFERRIRENILGVDAWLVSKEDLILSKIIWIQELQSDQQKSDIANLLEVKDLDREYISYWIQELDLNTFNLL